MRGTAPIFEDSNNSNLGLVLFNKGAKQQRQHRSNDSPRGVIDECVSIFRITQNIEYTVWSCACVACPSIRLLAACPMSPRHPDWMSRDRPFHYTRTHIVQLRKKGCPRVNCVPILSMANQTLCPFPGECHFLGIRWGISIIFLPRSSLFDKKLETSNAMRKVVTVLIDRLKPKCST